MVIKYKDFHRKMTPFKDESLDELIEKQVNEWIKINNVKVINVETLWERNTHVTVGIRVWYMQE
ncbi:hypothetical protein [Thermocrinis minervae]|uniref:Uncharacterized protein n=1 Tax=Thermocrinis minervae TaxID=381751 RepID=A0A1M6RG45_9AQUI|nr:hypothetical protein [Thermocrinis minervae]SHK31376.1 hypothetical protein SAMN05444391_0635 [Thermocrinis minervae]